MRKLEMHRQTQRYDIRRNRERLGFRDRSDFFSPCLLKRRRCNAMPLPVDEFELNGPEVAPRRVHRIPAQRIVQAHHFAHRNHDADVQGLAAPRRILRYARRRPMSRRLEFRDNLRRAVTGGPHGHLQRGGNHIAFNGGNKLIRDNARRNDAYRQDDQPQGAGDHNPGLGYAEPQRPLQRAIRNPLQQGVHAAARPVQHTGPPAPPPRLGIRQMSKVIRQHQQRFHQRKHQHGDHDHRDGQAQLRLRAGYEQQGRKRRHRREYRENDRATDPPRPPDCGGQASNAPFPFRIDAFPDHDRIVHHNAQCKHKAHQREHINRNPQQFHRQKGARKGNHQANRDPQGQTNMQE